MVHNLMLVAGICKVYLKYPLSYTASYASKLEKKELSNRKNKFHLSDSN